MLPQGTRCQPKQPSPGSLVFYDETDKDGSSTITTIHNIINITTVDDSSVIKVQIDEYERTSDDEEDVDNNDESKALFNPATVTRSGKLVGSFVRFM